MLIAGQSKGYSGKRRSPLTTVFEHDAVTGEEKLAAAVLQNALRDFLKPLHLAGERDAYNWIMTEHTSDRVEIQSAEWWAQVGSCPRLLKAIRKIISNPELRIAAREFWRKNSPWGVEEYNPWGSSWRNKERNMRAMKTREINRCNIRISA